MLTWAAEVFLLAETLPRSPNTSHTGLQLVRAASSGGANYEEARGAGSRADFVHRLTISTKETREGVFWLRLLGRTGALRGDRLAWAIDEGQQLVKILMSSARNARGRDQEHATRKR